MVYYSSKIVQGYNTEMDHKIRIEKAFEAGMRILLSGVIATGGVIVKTQCVVHLIHN